MLFKDFKINKVKTVKRSIFNIFKKTVNTSKLRNEIAENGPVSSVVAVNRSFQYYSSGVLNIDRCPSTQINHAVVTIGYSPD